MKPFVRFRNSSKTDRYLRASVVSGFSVWRGTLAACMLLGILFVTLNSAIASARHSPTEVQAHRRSGRLRRYGKSLVKRDSIAGIAGSAALGQATNSPHEWGRGAGGFAKRIGSGAARYVVKDSIQRGVGGILHEQRNNYVRADKPGFGPKLKSAAQNTFWVKHKNSNKRYPAYGRFAGAFGSGLISRAWQPARLHTVSSGLATGGVSLGADFGWNLAREYMPPPKAKAQAAGRRQQRYTRKG